MKKQNAASLLLAAGALMLLSGCIFAFMLRWIYAALAWCGAFGCLAAALGFSNQKNGKRHE